ncbi:MAG: hypothetical protein M3P49_11550 [Actinomycetota bacterium]|nr:hypothetical protein [Actinomycetota bacterium]
MIFNGRFGNRCWLRSRFVHWSGRGLRFELEDGLRLGVYTGIVLCRYRGGIDLEDLARHRLV